MMALLVALTLLGGCARVRTALALQPDDTVVGEIVVATPEKGPDDSGPVVTVPSELADAVDVSEYHQDGYAGSVLRFSGLTFAEVSMLATRAAPAGEAAPFALRRVGNRVLVDGSVDLTTILGDRADFQLKISFPGEVLETTGDAESGTVSWTFKPGEVGDVTAVAEFDDPNGPSVLRWSLLLAASVALAVGAVVELARRTRNAPIRRASR
ncbi:MAG: LppM family (lipo)protein [Pseudonocardia sp.]